MDRMESTSSPDKLSVLPVHLGAITVLTGAGTTTALLQGDAPTDYGRVSAVVAVVMDAVGPQPADTCRSVRKCGP